MTQHNKDNLKVEENDKPCRACMDFKSWMNLQKKQSNLEPNNKDVKASNISLQASGAFQKFNIPSEEDYVRRGKIKISSNQSPSISGGTRNPDADDISSWGSGALFGCPADSISLGRGSWRLLHTIAAYYPKNPSISIRNDMRSFLLLFSQFYPCKPCAEDFRAWIKENPPEVDSKSSLSKWLCFAHNDVNRKLGKLEFDCNLVDQRWSEGWKDGSCD